MTRSASAVARSLKKRFQRLFNYRIRALMKKEFNQIRRDRRLASSLILPPTLQLLLFGFALSANVTNLRLGVVDGLLEPGAVVLLEPLDLDAGFLLELWDER